MTKTISQIQMEMETVKLIKDTLDVNGGTAYKIYQEWTSKEKDAMKKDKGIVINDEEGNPNIVIGDGKLTLYAKSDVDENKYSWDKVKLDSTI